MASPPTHTTVPGADGPCSVALHCPACGKQLPNDPYFCAYCGTLIRAVPASLPRPALDLRTAGVALAGTMAALPVGAGFWLLAGQFALVPWAQRLELGLLAAVLTGTFGAVLRAQVRWPLDAQPPRCTPRQLSLTYGLAGGLTVVLGALLVGAVVLPLGWGLSTPSLPALLAGATSGFVGAAFAVPPALLVGALAGDILGRLASHLPAPAAAWAAALAWWLAGSAGGGVVGVFVATQTNFSIATGANLGALIQSALQVLLFPAATYLVRLTFVILS
jgi:hypothetical protein